MHARAEATRMSVQSELAVPPDLDALAPTRDLQLLAEIGLSSAARGFGDAAAPIFETLRRLRPTHAAADIGFGLTALLGGDVNRALRHLNAAAALPHGATEAKGFLLLALLRAGRLAEARALRNALSQGVECPAKRIAQSLTIADG